jgi:hypothetical protein
VAPELPAPVAAVIERCLRKPEAERYQTARELLADLQQALATPA